MRLPIAFILLASVLSGSLQASEARDWLLRMAEAGNRESFSGTYIYERSGNFSTHRIWHQAQPPASSRERLLQLDGPVQELLLADGQVRCATEALAGHFAGMQYLDGRQLDVARLEQTYELKFLGNSRVAGRSAVVLLLLPRDADRYARELHLDYGTGLPLKSLLLNEQGELLERMQFTSLNPRSLEAKDLQPVTRCIALPEPPAASRSQSAWQIGWMPAGFVAAGGVERPGKVSGLPLQTLVFDDGLARFSVFIEAVDDVVAGDAKGQVGPTVVVSRPMSTPGGQFMVTVVGEIPLATAERVLLSINQGGVR